MQRNSYLVTATRDAEKVPDIVQLARGSLINEIITVVVISLNLNPGRVGPPNGHLYHLVQRFFYGRGVLFMPRSSQQEINQTCTTIPQTVLQESNKMEIWTLSDTEKKKHIHQILREITLGWVQRISPEMFTHFVFGLLDDFETKLHQNSDRMTKYLDEPYMIIHKLKQNNRQQITENADLEIRNKIVQHLFMDNQIDWFLQRVGLYHSYDVQAPY
jgi:hypothetical protein